MKKIATLLSVVCVLNIFALAGLVAFLVASGRLDKTKAASIADLLRHQGTPDKLRAQVYDLLEPVATTAPSTAPATSRPVNSLAAESAPATGEERIDYTRQAMELERLQLENERQKLLEEQNRLAGVAADLDAKLKQIDAQKKTFEQTVTQSSSKTDDAAFEKTLALYAEMKPRQLKDILIAMPPEAVTKYIAAMEPDRVAKIVEEFKTPPEKTYIEGVLDRLRGAGTDSASGKSPTVATAPAPSTGALSAAAPRALSPAAP